MSQQEYGSIDTVTPNPPQASVYLCLFNGRTDPDEKLDDWGSIGPVLGPFDYCHTTYSCDIKVAGDADSNGKPFEDSFYMYGDLLYYDGVYYGDWSVTTLNRLSAAELASIQPFDATKTEPPAKVPEPVKPIRWTSKLQQGGWA